MNATCKHLIVALLAAVSAVASAADSPVKKQPGQLEKFSGIIHRVPEGGHGMWMVGTRTFEADTFTYINSFEAPAVPGNCAIVILRSTRAVQIITVDNINC